MGRETARTHGTSLAGQFPFGKSFRPMSALGQKRTFSLSSTDVRFTPKSGHSSRRRACPLCAKSGHQFGLEGNGPGTLCVIMGRLHITPDVDAISFTPQAIAVFADAPEPWLACARDSFRG